MEKQTVWLVFWQNGLEYDDFREFFVGVYSTKEKAQRYGRAFLKAQNKYYLEHGASYRYQEEIIK
jgi:hypothetical protein